MRGGVSRANHGQEREQHEGRTSPFRRLSSTTRLHVELAGQQPRGSNESSRSQSISEKVESMIGWYE